MDIKNYFSGNDNLQQKILEELDKAEKSICVAVAWLTDRILFSKLIEKQKEGIKVELIITKHSINENTGIDYSSLKKFGGDFVQIGDELGLMHNKFTIIDYNIVINGSFNWTNKANNSNNENISITSGNLNTVADFIGEFKRLQKLVGIENHSNIELTTIKIIKYFRLFKLFIDIGDVSKINPYLFEIKEIDNISHITKLLFDLDYDKAICEMDKFIQNNSQIVSVSLLEKIYLKSQIKMLSSQINNVEIEKTELEAKIEQFNHRCIIELNPYISKILELKKKIAYKLKKYNIDCFDYDKIDRDFKKASKEYLREKQSIIPELNEEDSKSIKQLYRKAVTLCHPDSSQCIYSDKTKACEIFDSLNKAYKCNDLEKVKYISNQLESGSDLDNIQDLDDLVILRAKYSSLKEKLEYLIRELSNYKSLDVYKIINNSSFENYFETQKEILIKEYEELKNKYMTHE